MEAHQNSPELAAQVDRARRFLRDIRDAIASHPVASKISEIRLHERREPTMSVLRLSGIVDRMPVEMHVFVYDHDPHRPSLQYSRMLERLRSARVMSVGVSAFTAAHDQACRTHYPDSERWQQTVQIAMEQSFAALTRGSLH